MKTKNILIHSIDFRGTICDGPGIRTILFLQGCSRHCKGCHNPQTWDFAKGSVWSINNLYQEICSKSSTKRITISGGEPLEQKDEILELIVMLYKVQYDITLYTGFNITDVPKEFFEFINYIKTGEYIQELKTSIIPYVGSSNQEFINVKLLLKEKVMR